MNPTFSLSEVIDFDERLAKVGRSFDGRVMGRALGLALQPSLEIARQEVRVGTVPHYKSGIVVRGRNKGNTRLTDGYYRKGGATRDDLRILIVKPEGNEAARGVVGVSQKKGKVGWRTHLLTRAHLHRHVADDFLTRTEERGVPLAISSLGQSARTIIEKILLRK